MIEISEIVKAALREQFWTIHDKVDESIIDVYANPPELDVSLNVTELADRIAKALDPDICLSPSVRPIPPELQFPRQPRRSVDEINARLAAEWRTATVPDVPAHQPQCKCGRDVETESFWFAGPDVGGVTKFGWNCAHCGDVVESS